MIHFPLSKIVDSSEQAVAPGANITAEGQALIRVTGAQSTGVQQSLGAATEVFAGFAVMGVSAAPVPALYATKVETFVVPGSGIVQLSQTPVAGQLAVFDDTTYRDWETDRKSTRLNSSHEIPSRMPSSA